jgi:RND family efflux transporter MFP subunit
MHTRTVLRVLLAAALAATASGCGAKKDEAKKGPEAALLAARDVVQVGRADLATGVPVQGTLEPSMDVTVIAPFPEILDAVLVKEGQAVTRGQVLARFRTESLAPAAASAEAQRRIAAADYTRMKNLLQEGAVSQRDVDGAEAQWRAAEAAAAMARKRLEEATVRARFDGVIAKRFVQGGDRLGDGDRLFRTVNIGELEFAASVPTEALGSVRAGAVVALTVSGLPGVSVTGRVARVNQTVDPATRQVKVYVTVPNRNHRLAGDLFASGRIVLSQAPGVLALPTAGISSGADGARFAWVVAGGRLERRPVTTGVRDELRDLIEVKSGLREGETAIVVPVEGLSPGQPVQIASDSTAAPASAGRAGGAAARREK